MKRTIIQYTTVVLAFLAGMIFMTYMTRMGNRDMTGDMAQAVAGRLCGTGWSPL